MSQDNIERLTKMLGFDPAKNQTGNQGDVLKAAIEEITEERAEKLQADAKTLLIQAIELRQQIKQAEAQFNGQIKKFNKTLGKLLNRIEAMAAGKEPPTEDDDKEDSKES